MHTRWARSSGVVSNGTYMCMNRSGLTKVSQIERGVGQTELGLQAFASGSPASGIGVEIEVWEGEVCMSSRLPRQPWIR